MNVKNIKAVKTSETVVIKIDRQDLIDFLKKVDITVPTNTQMYVEVPSGGDYSGMSLDIDSDTPIVIKYCKEATTTE